MIDWLSVRIPLYHQRIPQGMRMVIDVDGSVTSQTLLPRLIDDGESEEGSYSTRIMIQSEDECAYNHLLPMLSDKALFDDSNLARCLVISGNLAKYLQAHNSFGIECICSLLIATCDKIKKIVGLTRSQHKRLHDTIKAGHFEVTRIDITHMFDLETDAAVNRYIRMLQFCCDGRGNRAELCNNTFYVGKNSGLWSLKFYNKFKEINTKSKMHFLPSHLIDTGISEFVEGQLRVELVLRKKQLVRLNLNDKPLELNKRLDEIYQFHLDKIKIKHQQIDSIDVSTLPVHYQRTYLMWRAGHHVKDLMKHNTYYTHKRYFDKLGINLKLPPVPTDEREFDVKPLIWLMSKRVQQIPKALQQYQVQLRKAG